VRFTFSGIPGIVAEAEEHQKNGKHFQARVSTMPLLLGLRVEIAIGIQDDVVLKWLV
jgi:hypothetical protein